MKLEQRVLALEVALAEHRRAFEAILASSPMKMTGLRPGELLGRAISRVTHTPADHAEVVADIHPADALIKAGAKLKALSGELQR